MAKGKTFAVSAPRDKKMIVHLEAPKTRIQMKTVRSAQYSFYTKASRKAEASLKKELRSYLGK